MEKLEKNQLLDLAEFVATENFKNYKNNVNTINKKELGFFKNPEVFVTTNQKEPILGTIRILKWNYIDVIPLQKILGVNLFHTISNLTINNMYHTVLCTVKKYVHDINLFKKLLVCAAKPICNYNRNTAFAECDSKLVGILNLLGLKTMVIGGSVNYLGSETIPIAMAYNGVIDFYNKNKIFNY